MTRTELLQLVIAQARTQGLNLRRWYVSRLGREWPGLNAAIEDLASERRYYALLFSHEFACSFWRAGTEMSLLVPETKFPRVKKDGTVSVISRRGYRRRRVRGDAWRFHLREMAVHPEPLRYIRRFVRVEEDLEPEPEPACPIVVIDEEDLLPEDDE